MRNSRSVNYGYNFRKIEDRLSAPWYSYYLEDSHPELLDFSMAPRSDKYKIVRSFVNDLIVVSE